MDRNARSWRLRRRLCLRYAVLPVAVAAAWVLAAGDALFAAPLTWIAGATVLSPEHKDSGRQLNVLTQDVTMLRQNMGQIRQEMHARLDTLAQDVAAIRAALAPRGEG